MTLKFVWDQICLGCTQIEPTDGWTGNPIQNWAVLKIHDNREELTEKIWQTKCNASRKIARPCWATCMTGHCGFAKKDVPFFRSVATPCVDDHLIPPEDFEVQRELSDVCVQIVLKCFESRTVFPIGCARSNQQCPTAVPNRKSCRWMQVLRVSGLPALQFWDCVMQSESAPQLGATRGWSKM